MHVLGASSIPNLDVGIVDHAATVRAVEWGVGGVRDREPTCARKQKMGEERSDA